MEAHGRPQRTFRISPRLRWQVELRAVRSSGPCPFRARSHEHQRQPERRRTTPNLRSASSRSNLSLSICVRRVVQADMPEPIKRHLPGPMWGRRIPGGRGSSNPCSNVRTDAVLNAQWKDFDLDQAIWNVPLENLKDRKHRREGFRVPLSPRALDIVRQMAEVRVSNFVFPGHVRVSPFQTKG
jgi:hypothetical protein